MTWIKNRTYRPRALLPCRHRLSPKSEGQLISSEPEGVITQATTRTWRARAHARIHSKRARRVACGSRSVCRPCASRTRAPDSSSVSATLLKWFERHSVWSQKEMDVQQDFGDQAITRSRCFAFIFDHHKAKRKEREIVFHLKWWFKPLLNRTL